MSYLTIYRKYAKFHGLIITFLLCCNLFAFSQKNIEGNIQDSNKDAIPKATISIVNNTNLILSYTIADLKGHFVIAIPPNGPDSIFLQISAVGYKTILEKILVNNTLKVDFTLLVESKLLKSIIVKNKKPRIEASKDTLSYDVASFRNQQDRAIIDVIKKLPGIEVDALGKIRYNGKAISNLYIDGDNLLDDKYNLATNSLPSLMVDKIQVLENNQPIKVLQKVKHVDNVALNLILNEKAKIRLFGNANIGGSLDDLFEGNITGMMFKKKAKFINSLKTNNHGIDLEDEIISHNSSERLKETEKISMGGSLLNLNYDNNYDLSKERILFNNSILTNTNNLFNIKKDVQLRANIYYLLDDRRNKFQNTTKIFIPNDTISYTEAQNTHIKTQNLYSKINLEINKPGYYLNNNLIFSYGNKAGESNLLTNGNFITQNLSGNSNEFSNEIKAIKAINKNIIVEFHSLINSLRQPQTLHIEPGLYASILNNNIIYNGLIQNLIYPSFFTSNYISLTKGNGNLSQEYKIGFTSGKQQLVSSVNAQQSNGQINLIAYNFANNSELNRYKIFFNFENNWTTRNEKLKIKLLLPFTLQKVYHKDDIRKLNETKYFYLIEPDINIKYRLSDNYSFMGRLNFEKNINTIEEIYGGYILTNYRNFKNNQTPLNNNSRVNLSTVFSTRNNLKLRFFNTTFIYSNFKMNSISSATINNNVQFISNISVPNSNKRFQIIAGYGKYLLSIQSSLKLNISWSKNSQNVFQNNILLNFKNNNYSLDGSLATKINEKFNSNYTFLIQVFENKSIAIIDEDKLGLPRKNLFIQQQFNLKYLIANYLNIELNNEDFYNNENNYLFTDANVNFKIAKKNAEVGFEFTNIFNIKNFTSINLYSNSLSKNTYSIRSRMALLKLLFNF